MTSSQVCWSEEHPFHLPLPVASSDKRRASLVFLGREADNKIETNTRRDEDKSLKVT